MKKLVAVVAMSGAMMFGLASTATAGPASAPNVVGLSEVQAISVLESQGIKVRVATRNGSGPRPESCMVHHQQDLSGKTVGKTETVRVKVTYKVKVVDPETGDVSYENRTRSVPRVERTDVILPPSTTLNVVC